MALFKTQIRFLGHDMFQGTIKPIVRSLPFAIKFPDIIKDKNSYKDFLVALTTFLIFSLILDNCVLPYVGKILNHGLIYALTLLDK